MTTNHDNLKRLREAMIAFRDHASSSSFRDVLVAAHVSMRQGSGLGWQQVDELIYEVFGQRPSPPTIPRSE